VHRDRARHGNAEGLSRRPPEANESTEDTKNDKADEVLEADVRFVTQERGAAVLVGENFAQLEQNDAELGDTVRFCLAADEAPTNEDLQPETDLTKKTMTKWNEFKVYNGLVFRNRDSPKKSELNFYSCCYHEAKLTKHWDCATLKQCLDTSGSEKRWTK